MLVALEGIDGSGKGTQTKLLQERAIKNGIKAVHISFPQYGKNAFAQVVQEYLNGRFGGVDDVHPKLAALLFAGDRFASKSLIEQATKENALVIFDRYVASNLAHQAAKLRSDERQPFIEWLSEIEYGLYRLSKPDLTVFLDVPVEQAQRLVHSKPAERGYTALKEDIHEKDADYLRACRDVYDTLAASDIGGRWERVICYRSGIMRAVEDIAEEVWDLVKPPFSS